MISERTRFVYIVLPGSTQFVTAARFRLGETRDGVALGELVYGKNYLQRPDAVELDPVELRLGAKHYEAVRLHGFFGAIRDAMPDFWGRRVIERHVAKSNFEEFDYLLHGPDDRAGALGFGLSPEPTAPRRHFNQTLDLESLQKAVGKILSEDAGVEEEPEITAQVQELLLQGTSMGGARPKAVIEDNSSLWIAKFSNPQDRWNQPLVEYALLQLAKSCGIIVADSKVVVVANKPVLMVRRFDRDRLEDGYGRHRMVSALTLLKSEEAATLREGWSYLLLADEIRRISVQPMQDLHELFRRTCFNAAVSNLDDHPRNHAVLAKASGWQLSPAYDLTPTPTVARDNRLLAMECGHYGRLARRDNLLSACGRFFLSYSEAEAILDFVIETVSKEWHACLRRAGANENDCEVVANAFVYEGFYYSSQR